MAKYKIGDKVVKNHDNSHPDRVKGGTNGVITEFTGEFCRVVYDDPIYGKNSAGLGWCCVPDWEFVKKRSRHVKLGNRHTEHFISFAEKHFQSFFKCHIDTIPFPYYEWDGSLGQKEIIISLLCLIDDETFDAWVKEFK